MSLVKKHSPFIACLLVTLLLNGVLYAQNNQEIRQLLQTQTQCWNSGDITGFMQTYWKSDSLMFIGKNGVKKGWQTTLDNYRKSYPDKEAMGHLGFDILEIKKLSPEYCYVVGKWMLKRTAGDLSGHFDLLLQRIHGKWKIISDHSS